MSVPTSRTSRSPFSRSARRSAAVPGAPEAETSTVTGRRLTAGMQAGRRAAPSNQAVARTGSRPAAARPTSPPSRAAARSLPHEAVESRSRARARGRRRPAVAALVGQRGRSRRRAAAGAPPRPSMGSPIPGLLVGPQRHPEVGGRGDVVSRSRGRGEVPVDERDRAPSRKITFGQKRSSWQTTDRGRDRSELPRGTGGRLEPGLRLVHLAQERAEPRDGSRRRRAPRGGGLAFHEREDLAALVVDAEVPGAPSKPTRSKCRRSACTAGPTSGRCCDAPCRRRRRPPTLTSLRERDLGHARSIRSLASCASRASRSASSKASIVSRIVSPG